ncbi:MAG: hypothetical protein ACRD3Q_12080, partial [Terriglobales bacterium]
MKRDGVWIDVLTGSLDSAVSATPISAAHMFSTGRGVPGYGGPAWDAYGFASPLTWIGDGQIAFLFGDAQDTRQVVTVGLKRRTVQFETKSPTQIYAFDMASGDTLVYLAGLSKPTKKPLPTGGFVVPERTNAMAIIAGYLDGSTADTRAANAVWFVKRSGESAERVAFEGGRNDGWYPQLQHVSIAPDGDHAIVSAPAVTVPADWDQFAGRTEGYEEPVYRAKFAEARADSSSAAAREVMQLYLIDTRRHTAKPMWNAIAPRGAWHTFWSPDGRRAVLTSVPIPVAEQNNGRVTVQTVVFDSRTGEHWVVPTNGHE